ncbi:hypothetical protein [Roseivirga sp. UBA1976]|uniref:hypothetical protein n=1 Tax=Roseivirga sp. UBA1976 TaxID=1947386 RepID=UPI00257F0BD4|nr:hypothetical protein [Roseivirga sp. UBA1976]|tara:strand:+ start:1380 stop:1616 length:237 start_codon:yes stop_codon:yes gene_type:complete
MGSLYYDLILSGLTYVLLTYLTFTLMRRRKRSDSNGDEGGINWEEGPQIDLPPGVVWPTGPPDSEPRKKQLKKEELVY